MTGDKMADWSESAQGAGMGAAMAAGWNEMAEDYDGQQQDSSVEQLSCGIRFQTDFWQEKYLKEYIRDGGSKMKFISGRPGSGKTHFLGLMASIAREEGYKVVQFSAKDIWMHDFKEIYVEIFKQCDICDCLEAVSHHLIREMGFDPGDISEGMKFMDYLSQSGLGDALNKREIRAQLRQMFLDNPMMDNNFALACSMLTGSILGYPVLEEQNRELLLAWLEGDRSIKLSQLRAMDFYPGRITRYNARHMLRSLAEVVRMGGFSGLYVSVDDMEILVSRSSLEAVHYTKMKREDTYESIRQLIDDIDSMKNIMFVYAFDRELIDNENAGLKSYQALWMRIQNEIVGERFNRFADVVDLDRLAAQEYDLDVIISISESLARQQNTAILPLDRSRAEEIAARARTGAVGVPKLIQMAMQEVRGNV